MNFKRKKPAQKTQGKSRRPQKQQEDELVFVDGISVFEPHKNAPDFIIADVSIDPRRFVDFLTDNPEVLSSYSDKSGKDHKCLRLQLKESKAGNLYMSINDFQPEEKDDKPTRRRGGKSNKTNDYENAEDVTEPVDDLPF